jgi:hypothetical protein
VTLPPGLSISGRILNADGMPWPRRPGRVWAFSRVGRWEDVGVDSEGNFEEKGFSPGRVALVHFPDREHEPRGEPEDQGLPVHWFEAGTKDILLRLPPR